LKYPLKELVVIPNSEEAQSDVEAMVDYIKEEVNVRAVKVTLNKSAYGVQLKADLNYKTMGEKLEPAERKTLMQKLSQAVKNMPTADLEKFVATKSMVLFDKELTADDVNVTYAIAGDLKHYKAHSDGQFVTLLDLTADQAMLDEGLKREIVNRMQKQRKQAKLLVTDQGLDVYATTTPGDGTLARVLNQYKGEMESTTKQSIRINERPEASARVLDKSDFPIKAGDKQETLHLSLVDTRPASSSAVVCNGAGGDVPAGAVRVVYTPAQNKQYTQVIPLVSKKGDNMDFDTLNREVRAAFSEKNVEPTLTRHAFRMDVDGVSLNKANMSRLASGGAVVHVQLQ